MRPDAIVAILVITVGAAACPSVGCSGEIVIGAGGDGGAGAGSGGLSGGGSSTSSGSGGALGSLCAGACARIDECLDAGFDCLAKCESLTECVAEHDELLRCVIDHSDSAGGCELPYACSPDLAAYLSCRGVAQVDDDCHYSSYACFCHVFDEAGHEFRSGCQADSDCSCSFDGQFIGSCAGSPYLNGCEPFLNCCRTLLFVPGYP